MSRGPVGSPPFVGGGWRHLHFPVDVGLQEERRAMALEHRAFVWGGRCLGAVGYFDHTLRLPRLANRVTP